MHYLPAMISPSTIPYQIAGQGTGMLTDGLQGIFLSFFYQFKAELIGHTIPQDHLGIIVHHKGNKYSLSFRELVIEVIHMQYSLGLLAIGPLCFLSFLLFCA